MAPIVYKGGTQVLYSKATASMSHYQVNQQNNGMSAQGQHCGRTNAPADDGYSMVPRSMRNMNWNFLYDITSGQPVEVRLKGRGWAVGVALTCMKFFEIISGEGYQVKYMDPRTRNEEQDYFLPHNVRRPQPSPAGQY